MINNILIIYLKGKAESNNVKQGTKQNYKSKSKEHDAISFFLEFASRAGNLIETYAFL